VDGEQGVVLELMDMVENKKIKIKKTLLLGGRRAGSGAGIDRYGRKD
jgi:hypothetical protein